MAFQLDADDAAMRFQRCKSDSQHLIPYTRRLLFRCWTYILFTFIHYIQHDSFHSTRRRQHFHYYFHYDTMREAASPLFGRMSDAH